MKKEDEIQIDENKSGCEIEDEMNDLLEISGDQKFNNIDNNTKITYLDIKRKKIQAYIRFIEFSDWKNDDKIYFINKYIDEVKEYMKQEAKGDADIMKFFKNVIEDFETLLYELIEKAEGIYDHDDDDDDDETIERTTFLILNNLI